MYNERYTDNINLYLCQRLFDLKPLGADTEHRDPINGWEIINTKYNEIV